MEEKVLIIKKLNNIKTKKKLLVEIKKIKLMI